MSLRSAVLVACLSASAAVLTGCGSSSTTTVVATPTPTLSLATAATVVGQGGTIQYTATTNLTATDLIWEVNGVAGGSSTTGTVSTTGLYTAPSSGAAATVTVSVLDKADASVTASAPVSVIGAATVATTANPQTASYTVDLPSAGTVSVEFGPTTSYGRSTWTVSGTAAGPVTVLVAGMPANTTAHMRADVTLAGGGTWNDADHSFAVGLSLPGPFLPQVAVTTAAGQTPQPGIEFVTAIYQGAAAFDLSGNLLWGYELTPNEGTSDILQPATMLPNGNVLLTISPLSNWIQLGGLPSAATVAELREVDLANNTVHSLTIQELQNSLNNSGYKDNQGNVPTLLALHHEATYNTTTGHWLLIASYEQTDTPTDYPDGIGVVGDIVMDVDPNNNFALDFIWNEFDHFDINRQPFGFPDWTHTNAIVYSKDDGNILVSIRHQSWVVKVNYQDAKGDGSILWRLGYQGDFTLTNETGPQDWQYQQHGPSFTTSNTTGKFGLTLMDNGDQRTFPDGYTCQQGTAQPCQYSRTPIFSIDETAMTATISNTASETYSYFGGNAEVLPNGNMHGAYSSENGTPSVILETTVGDTPTPVWTMTVPPGGIYRGSRVGSMYPGVQWMQ